MGLYATTTAIATRLVNVDFDSATTDLSREMIADAEAEVNKYICKRYDLSSATFQTSGSIPPMVTALATRLAEGYMWCAMSRGSKESLARGNSLIKGVMENLKELAEYKAALVSTSGALIVESSNTAYRVLSNTETYTETFAEDDPLDWAVDRDKLDDIANERD